MLDINLFVLYGDDKILFSWKKRIRVYRT